MAQVQEKEPGPNIRPLFWYNIVFLCLAHLISLHSLYYIFTFQVQWKTLVWGFVLSAGGFLGLTAGAHRLYAHRSYKAKLPLRIFLTTLHVLSYHYDPFTWAREHRVHHKYSDTDADPYTSNRGFFFSHYGWLCYRKHPLCREKSKTIDLSDLKADPVLMFHKKYFYILGPILAFIMPTVVPILCWGESFYISYIIAVFKFTASLNLMLCINSVGHKFGMKPWDKNIRPSDNKWYHMASLGEGFHNFHHTFPVDYRSAETHSAVGNFTTGFIRLMAFIGQAYDLKTVSPEVIEKRRLRTGNHSDYLKSSKKILISN